MVITKDENIRRRPLEREAVRVARVSLFALGGGSLSGAAMSAALVAALPRMVALLGRTQPPVIARVTQIGVVSILDAFKRGR